MTLIRPELADALWRAREVIAAAALGLFGLWLVSLGGPVTGGAVSLPDLVELRLMTLRGRRLWRLKQSDGQALLIPVEARGADALFDAFAALPGLDTGDLVAALQGGAPAGATVVALASESRLVWVRTGRGMVRS